jgi:hypothetical protein
VDSQPIKRILSDLPSHQLTPVDGQPTKRLFYGEQLL